MHAESRVKSKCSSGDEAIPVSNCCGQLLLSGLGLQKKEMPLDLTSLLRRVLPISFSLCFYRISVAHNKSTQLRRRWKYNTVAVVKWGQKSTPSRSKQQDETNGRIHILYSKNKWLGPATARWVIFFRLSFFVAARIHLHQMEVDVCVGINGEKRLNRCKRRTIWIRNSVEANVESSCDLKRNVARDCNHKVYASFVL